MQRPDFFIVGAPKSGTTALAHFLRQHPHIYMIDPRREPLYFAADLPHKRAVRNLEQYLEFFAGSTPEDKAIGEKSVFYLCSEVAAREIKAFNAAARIIIMLRNPVDMMHALHGHMLLSADEDIVDFAAALDAEEDRRQGRRLPARGDFPTGILYRRVAGYPAQVRRFLEAFGRDKVLIIIFDDFKADTGETYRRTLEFLGVDPEFQPSYETVNPSRRPRSRILNRLLVKPPRFLRTLHRASPFRSVESKVVGAVRDANIEEGARPPMDPRLRKRLQAQLAPEVAELSGLLERPLTHWTED